MLEILAVGDTLEDYLKYKKLIKEHLVDVDLLRVFDSLETYYDGSGVTNIDWSAFSAWFYARNPLIKDDKAIIFNAIFTKLGSVDTTLKSGIVDTFLRRAAAEKIAFSALQVAEGRTDDLAEVQKELDEYMSASGMAVEADRDLCTDDLGALLTTVSHGAGLNWRLNALNESLGPLRKGNLVFLGARPEVGKTTCLASETTFMAQQMPPEKKVLYFGNEEAVEAVKMRLYSAALGIDLATLKSDPVRYQKEYATLMHGDANKIMVIGKANMTTWDIMRWLKKTDVDLIVIDQLRKVQGFDNVKGGIQRLERVFQWAREISKEYAPVLTVGQLDAEAQDEQYPGLARLYESKTAVQGECDAIIMIGAVTGSLPPNARWLNIVKNKFSTPGNPALRHARHEVSIHSEIARYS